METSLAYCLIGSNIAVLTFFLYHNRKVRIPKSKNAPVRKRTRTKAVKA
jgi:hypothetical protein